MAQPGGFENYARAKKSPGSGDLFPEAVGGSILPPEEALLCLLQP